MVLTFFFFCFSVVAIAYQSKIPKRFKVLNCKDLLDIEIYCLHSADFPALVVKASGLAAGKGVIIAESKEEACKAVQEIMQVS